MAKPLVLVHDGTEIPLQLEKVDRTKLYGWVETEVHDDKGRRCDMAQLTDDGRTIVPRGGRAIAYLSAQGMWCDKSSLAPVDAEGAPIVPVVSSYAAPIPLATPATVDDVLAHDIRLAYRVAPDAGAEALAAAVRGGAIWTFPYSFRGGLEADQAFLLEGADGHVFLLVGRPCAFEYVGLRAPVWADEGEDLTDDDDLDFGMI